MRIGLVTEIKPGERRCALTPAGAREITADGHRVLVQAGAGAGSGFADGDYAASGASVIDDPVTIWDQADLLLKVKEPVAEEYELLNPDQILFTYLHLAADRPLTEALIASGTTAVAYETVEDADGRLPLLAPMSEVAGRLAGQAGAYFLQEPFGGRGMLMGGVPGVAPARVTVLGGGVVGTQAARVACGMGAEVTILDRSLKRLRELDELFDGRARIVMSSPSEIEAQLPVSDVVIGAVLIPGAAAPKLITRDMLSQMPPRASARRCRDRSGRVLRDIPSDDTPGSLLRRRRRAALLRGEHAWSRSTHLHDGVDKRHASLCAGAREVGHRRAHRERSRGPGRCQRSRRRVALRARCGCVRGTGTRRDPRLDVSSARARQVGTCGGWSRRWTR